MPWSDKRPICRCWTSTAPMSDPGPSSFAGGSSPRGPWPGARAATCWSCSSASRASPGEAMSCRFTSFISLTILIVAGCGEVRGRKKIQEANELYKRGRYREAVASFEAAEALVPQLPTLWLNKGYTCRQLIAPGGHDPESQRAADCALGAFRKLHELSPNDARAEQLM